MRRYTEFPAVRFTETAGRTRMIIMTQSRRAHRIAVEMRELWIRAGRPALDPFMPRIAVVRHERPWGMPDCSGWLFEPLPGTEGKCMQALAPQDAPKAERPAVHFMARGVAGFEDAGAVEAAARGERLEPRRDSFYAFALYGLDAADEGRDLDIREGEALDDAVRLYMITQQLADYPRQLAALYDAPATVGGCAYGYSMRIGHEGAACGVLGHVTATWIDERCVSALRVDVECRADYPQLYAGLSRWAQAVCSAVSGADSKMLEEYEERIAAREEEEGYDDE